MKKRLLFAALCLVLLLSCVGCSAKKPGVDLREKLDALTVSDEDLGIKDQFSALSDITGGSIDDALVGRWVSADGRTSYTYAADGTQKIESEDYGDFDVKYTCITCGDYRILCEEVPMTSSDAEGNATESTALSYTAYEIENDVLYMAMVEEHDPMYTTNQTALVSMFKADGSGSAARSMAKNPIDLSCLNGTWVTEKGSFTIENGEDVIPASKQVEDFCKNNGASEKQSMMLSLFVEELSNNIIRFGFADKKKHSIDIRVIRLDDGWTLRMRDNCKKFDPTEWLKMHNTDDPTKNIGIRMVTGMAKDINYLSTMDLNNITITI